MCVPLHAETGHGQSVWLQFAKENGVLMGTHYHVFAPSGAIIMDTMQNITVI